MIQIGRKEERNKFMNEKKMLVWVLEVITQDAFASKSVRSVVQKDLRKNAKKLHLYFTEATRLEKLRLDLILLFRQMGERDFTPCKKITNTISDIKAKIQHLESRQKFMKKLLKRL